MKSALKSAIESAEEAMVDQWINLARDGAACDLEAMEETARRIMAMFEEEGFRCRLEDAGLGIPPVLVGYREGGSQDRRPIIFTGHYDTVFKKGEWSEPAYRTEDGLLRGPGVLDMKGGIIAALFTARALRELGESCPLKLVLAGDEEVGHENGRAAEILSRECEGGYWAFNMETGFENQDVCIGRKGTATCILKVTGKASHPGNAFEEGRNAIVEMALKIAKLSGLTQLKRGITVSAGKIQGGTAANVIAESCAAEVDLRFRTMKDYEELQREIEEICALPHIEGTRTEVSYGEMLPPYETTDRVMELFGCVRRAAEELGRDEIGGRVRGGASDAACVAQSGTPVLCSMGVRGGESHSLREYAVIDSLRERTELLTYLIVNRERLRRDCLEQEEPRGEHRDQGQLNRTPTDLDGSDWEKPDLEGPDREEEDAR